MGSLRVLAILAIITFIGCWPSLLRADEAQFSAYDQCAREFRRQYYNFLGRCEEDSLAEFAVTHSEAETRSRITHCLELTRLIRSEEERCATLESEVTQAFSVDSECEPETRTEVDQLADNTQGIVSQIQCSESDKRQNWRSCMEDVGCVAASSMAGLLGNFISEYVAPASMQQCLSFDNNCLGRVVEGLVTSVWNLVGGVWELLKTAGGWVAQQAGDFWDWVTGVEDATSNAHQAIHSMSESELDLLYSDPLEFMSRLFSAIWEAIKNWLKTDVFCEEWDPPRRLSDITASSRCVRPFTGFECMTCGTMITGICEVAGVAIAEIVPALFTGGAASAAKWGAQGISRITRLLKTSRLVDRVQNLNGVRRIGQALTLTSRAVSVSTRVVTRYVFRPALLPLKQGFRLSRTTVRRIQGSSAYRAAGRQMERLLATPPARLARSLVTTHNNVQTAAFRLGYRAIDDVVENTAVRVGRAARVTREGVIASRRVQRYIQQFSRMDFDGIDNAQFIGLTNGSRAVPVGKKLFYFDVENSVLKQLNDHVIVNKALVDAISNRFNQLFYQRVLRNPQLASVLEGRYLDYKSLRLAFAIDEAADTGQYESLLRRIYYLSTQEFEREMRGLRLNRLYGAATGQIGNPRTWFLAGTGDTALEANMAARRSRMFVNESPRGRLTTYGSQVEAIAERVNDIDTARQALAGNAAFRQRGVMVAAQEGSDQLILSRDVIQLLRKTKRSNYQSLDQYRSTMREQLRRLYGQDVTFDDRSIDAMTSYFEGVDSLSPPIFVEGPRVPMPLEQASQDIVSVDFAGIGVENAYQAMRGLASAEMTGDAGQIARQAMREISERVDTVTDDMDVAQRAFARHMQAVDENTPPAHFSGDDGLAFPPGRLSQQQRQQLVGRLADHNPSQYRLTFVESQFADGTPIPVSDRSTFIVRAETLEKDLRRTITGTGDGLIPPDQAAQMMFAIEYAPSPNGGAFRIIVGGNVSASQRQLIQQTAAQLLPDNHSLDAVTLVQ